MTSPQPDCPPDSHTLLAQLNLLVHQGKTLVVVEHDMRVALASNWIIGMGPGAEDGGRIVATAIPAAVSHAGGSHTALYLARALCEADLES